MAVPQPRLELQPTDKATQFPIYFFNFGRSLQKREQRAKSPHSLISQIRCCSCLYVATDCTNLHKGICSAAGKGIVPFSNLPRTSMRTVITGRFAPSYTVRLVWYRALVVVIWLPCQSHTGCRYFAGRIGTPGFWRLPCGRLYWNVSEQSCCATLTPIRRGKRRGGTPAAAPCEDPPRAGGCAIHIEQPFLCFIGGRRIARRR